MAGKRYLIFDAYYDTAGGNQRYIRMLFDHARPDNWQPVLACPGEGWVTEGVRAGGGETIIVPQPGKLDRYDGRVLKAGPIDRIATLFALVAYNFRILGTLRETRPDVIQCNNVRSLLMVGIAAALLRIPAVLFIKGEMGNPLLDRLAIALAARVFFISEALMPARRSARFRTLPIGVDFTAVDAVVAKRASAPSNDRKDADSPLRFAFAGWLTPAKGIHVLIDAFERTTHQCPGIALDIIGDSTDAEYLAELRNVVAWHDLGDRVTFHGWRDDALEAIADADIFVLPSFTEGVPRSIVEAMALGKPVIATNVGGVPDLLERGALGMIVAPNDSVALSVAMTALASDPACRDAFAEQGRRIARERYSFEAHLGRLENLLDEAAATPASGAAAREYRAEA